MSGARKILIADDSPVVSKMLSMVLRGAGYEVVLATDGIEATQAVYNEMPDLVVLDIFMPRMNGYQVCRLLKHDPAVAHIPVTQPWISILTTRAPARHLLARPARPALAAWSG